jgi:hypothetical protein
MIQAIGLENDLPHEEVGDDRDLGMGIGALDIDGFDSLQHGRKVVIIAQVHVLLLHGILVDTDGVNDVLTAGIAYFLLVIVKTIEDQMSPIGNIKLQEPNACAALKDSVDLNADLSTSIERPHNDIRYGLLIQVYLSDAFLADAIFFIFHHQFKQVIKDQLLILLLLLELHCLVEFGRNPDSI